MSRNTKIALGIIGGIVVLCTCISVLGFFALRQFGQNFGENAIAENPEDAKALAESMIDYDLPPGYAEEGGFNMFFAKMVFIEDATAYGPTIMLTQYLTAAYANDPQMQQQLQEQMVKSFGTGDTDFTLVGEKVVTIRDQEVTFLIYEGESYGTQMRQMFSIPFEGKSGTIMVMIMGTVEGWNEEEIDAFLESLR